MYEEYYETSSDSLNWYPIYWNEIAYHEYEMTSSSVFADLVAHKQALNIFFPTSVRYSKLSQLLDTNLEQIDKVWFNSPIMLRMLFVYDNQGRIAHYYRKGFYEGQEYSLDEDAIYFYHEDNSLYEILHLAYDAPVTSGQGINTWIQDFMWETYSTGNDEHTALSPQDLIISVYPNPFCEKLNIKLESKTNQPVKIDIYNLKGQLIYDSVVEPNMQFSWNDSKAASGVYFVKVSQGRNTQTKKIIKIR